MNDVTYTYHIILAEAKFSSNMQRTANVALSKHVKIENIINTRNNFCR